MKIICPPAHPRRVSFLRGRAMAISKKLIRVKPKKTAPDPPVLKIKLETIYLVPSEFEDHQHILDLFAAFKYDIRDAQHWLHLLSILSKGYFDRKQGRPSKWNGARRSRMFADLYMLIKEKAYRGDRKAQAKLLKEKLKLDPFYRDASEEEIRKHLLKFFREEAEWEIALRRLNAI
jgi:hypothetical protein